MAITEKTTLRSEYLAHLLAQFVDKPNFRALIGAWVQELQDLEAAAFEVIDARVIATAVGTQLDNIGKILTEARESRSDTDYRAALEARILINVSQGTAEQIFAVFELLKTGANVAVMTEQFPAEFVIDVTGLEPNGNRIASTIRDMKGAGIGALLRWADTAPLFLFDTVAQGLDDGLLTHSLRY